MHKEVNIKEKIRMNFTLKNNKMNSILQPFYTDVTAPAHLPRPRECGCVISQSDRGLQSLTLISQIRRNYTWNHLYLNA